MTTRVVTHGEGFAAADIRSPTAAEALRYLALIGRILFSAIFILASFGHFTQAYIGYAAKAGVPIPQLLVPISGLLALIGGLSVLLGYHARIGAILLVVFLVPVTLWMHAFWAVKDPAMAAIQMSNFMKNLSMIGAALLILYFGPGPLSLDARHARTIAPPA